MEIVWFISGLILGLVIGSGAVLFYVNRKFRMSMERFEEEMDLFEEFEEESKNREE